MTDAKKNSDLKKNSESTLTGTHPIAHPIAADISSSLPLADTGPNPLGGTNDGAQQGTTPIARRRRTTDIAAIDGRLSDRDRAILRSVAEHQFLTGRQITAIHFDGHAAISGPRIARRVLARLRELRLLGTLERRVGGIRAGSDGLVYYVDTVGDQLLRGRSGRNARRSREPSARFLSHRLAIAETHIELLVAHRRGYLDVVDCAVEPASWRRYASAYGTPVTLKPDLSAETGADEHHVHAWFIEVDLGTESIPTLLRKCRDYEAYRRTRIEQDRSGSFPVVIWSVTHRNPDKAKTRRSALGDGIAADRSLPDELFRIIAPQQLLPLLRTGGQQ